MSQATVDRRPARRCDFCERAPSPTDPSSALRTSEVLGVTLCQRCIAESVTIAIDVYELGLEDDEEPGGR